MKYSTFFRDSTHILLTRDFISMMKEVPLYHQMNGGIHMNQDCLLVMQLIYIALSVMTHLPEQEHF